MTDKWPRIFLGMARYVAEEMSKDPDKKVGAVLVSPDRTTITPGYNGFPKGIEDTPERLSNKQFKLDHTVHAEVNAVINCPVRPMGYALYVWPIPPCLACSGPIIQAGIKEVWAPKPPRDSSWWDTCCEARETMEEAGITCHWLTQ